MAAQGSFTGPVTLTMVGLPSASSPKGQATAQEIFTVNPVNNLTTSYVTVSEASVFFPNTLLSSSNRSAFADGGLNANGEYTISIEATTNAPQCLESGTAENRTFILDYNDSDINPLKVGS